MLPRPSHAGILSSLIKFFSGTPGEVQDSIPAFIHETHAAVDSSAVDAGNQPQAADGGAVQSPFNVIQDQAILAPLNPLGTMPLTDSEAGQIFTYTVRSGDSISSIAKMFDVTQSTIRWANNLSPGQGPKSGDELVILPVSGVSYVVKKGDTVAKIAKQYRASVDDIMQFNGLAPDENPVVGSTVIIPNGELVESAPITGSSSKSKSFSNLPVYDGYYLRPISGGRKTQGIHGFNGVDLANSCGTPIVASATGMVIIARATGWNGGYGEYVVIAHNNGTQTLYGHVSKVEVASGESVAQGQEIGTIGTTGNSTGCHVHFEIRGARNPF